MSRYAIWNKTDPIYTPGGPVYTAEQWMDKYGWMKNPRAVPVVSDGLVNGGFVGELSEMVKMAQQSGAEFTEGAAPAQLLEEYEAWLDAQNAPVDPADIPVTPEERTAAALEFLAMNSLPDDV